MIGQQGSEIITTDEDSSVSISLLYKKRNENIPNYQNRQQDLRKSYYSTSINQSCDGNQYHWTSDSR